MRPIELQEDFHDDVAVAWLGRAMTTDLLPGEGFQFDPPPRIFHEPAQPFFVSLNCGPSGHGVGVGVSPHGPEADIDVMGHGFDVDDGWDREDHQKVTVDVRTAADAQQIACR